MSVEASGRARVHRHRRGAATHLAVAHAAREEGVARDEVGDDAGAEHAAVQPHRQVGALRLRRRVDERRPRDHVGLVAGVAHLAQRLEGALELPRLAARVDQRRPRDGVRREVSRLHLAQTLEGVAHRAVARRRRNDDRVRPHVGRQPLRRTGERSGELRRIVPELRARRIAPKNCADELRARARGAHVVGHLPQRLVGEGEVARARRGVEQRVVGDEGGAQRAPPHRLDHRRRALRVGRLGERVDQRVARLHVGRDAAVEGVAVELDGEVAAPRRAGARDERAVRHLRRLQPRRDEPPEDALRLAQPLLVAELAQQLVELADELVALARVDGVGVAVRRQRVGRDRERRRRVAALRRAAPLQRPPRQRRRRAGVCERCCLAARTTPPTRPRGRTSPTAMRGGGARSQASRTRAVIMVISWPRRPGAHSRDLPPRRSGVTRRRR